MFVNIPLLTHSDFFMHFIEDDMKEYYNQITDKTNVLGIVGAYSNIDPDMSFNPLLVHEHKNQHRNYGRISLKNKKSFLNRSRKLKEVFYQSYVFQNDDEDYQDFIKRKKDENKIVKLVTYGSADEPEQIMKRFDFLDQIKDRFFVIDMTLLVKEDEPKTGGFRQHKNGPYIGNKNMQYEYFSDEGDEFEYIVRYHIYEITFGCKHPVVTTDNFKVMICEDTPRATYMQIFDKNDSLVCYAYRDSKETPNILTFTVNTDNHLFNLDKTSETFYTDLDKKLTKLINEFSN